MMWRVLVLLSLACVPAFGYLDPGSGSLLLSSVVAIFASVVFFIKNLFYKLTSFSTSLSGGFSPSMLRGGGNYARLKASIVFYSEGKQYYFTFKPILDALDSLKHPYIYYTSGQDDPALLREGEHSFGVFEYIGEGNKAYVKLNTLRADICVLTTPGLDVLQIRRSRGVRHYCHIVHSLTPMTYRAFGLDYFDSVLVVNEIQRDFVREVEAAHGVKRKYISIVGSTYLDELASLRHSALGNSSLAQSLNDFGGSARSFMSNKLPSPHLEKHSNLTQDTRITDFNDIQSHSHTAKQAKGAVSLVNTRILESSSRDSKENTESTIAKDSNTHAQEPLSAQETTHSDKPTILLSPSWGKETILSKYGLKLLEPLAQSGFYIIIRPHPQSLISEAESSNIATLQNALKSYQNIEWDIGTPNVYAFARADMMISDFSSVIFDFVCLEGKPVLTMDFAFDPAGYDLSDIDLRHFYTFETLKRIGGKLQSQDFSNIAEIITQVLESNRSCEVQQCKEELWRYPHESGVRAASELLKIERELLEREIASVLPQVRRVIELDSMLKHSAISANGMIKQKHAKDKPSTESKE